MIRRFKAYSVSLSLLVLAAGCSDSPSSSSGTNNTTVADPTVATFTGNCGMNLSNFIADTIDAKNVAFRNWGSMTSQSQRNTVTKVDRLSVKIPLVATEKIYPEYGTLAAPQADVYLYLPKKAQGVYTWDSVDVNNGIQIIFGTYVDGQMLTYTAVRGTTTVEEMIIQGPHYYPKGTFSAIMKTPSGKLVAVSGRYSGC